jgi:hypothetical protein
MQAQIGGLQACLGSIRVLNSEHGAFLLGLPGVYTKI